ncbi:DrmB family protein [Desulfovibrio sp. QI0430]
MPNNDLGEIRRSAIILTAAPGAVVDFRAEGSPISAVIAGLDDWDTSFPPVGLGHQQVVYEERLQKKLGVCGFRLPPVLPPKRLIGPNNTSPALLAARFPNWLQCPQCNRLAPAAKWGNEAGRPWRRCQHCSTKGHTIFAIPVRFVMACEKGHLDEFPWHLWVGHKDKECNGEYGFLKLTAEGPGLAGLVLSCPKCGASKTLDGIFSAKNWKNRNFRCSKKRPWLGDVDPQPCTHVPRAMQRGASNMFYPCVETALSIPPWSDNLPENLGVFWGSLVAIPDLKDKTKMIEILAPKGLGDILRYLGLTPEELARQIERREQQLVNADCNNLRDAEYYQFTSSTDAKSDEDQNFEMREEKVPPSLSNYFSHIVRLVRLREVRALKGFTRIYPPGMDGANIAPISKEPKQWLPAVEVKGEGIFISFNLETLHKWETRVEIMQRAGEIQKEYTRQWKEKNGTDTPVDRVVTPRFLLVHTFAHALMRQLTLECGYSSTALRERLYVDDTDMAGLIIYTATSDADGTLGGLQRQGKETKIGSTVPKAIQSIEWCSSDPLCISGLMCGNESLCAAACHSCVLAPETSCEEFNHFLDRGMVTGWAESPYGGYFSALKVASNG